MGREAMDSVQSILWTQRIEKEMKRVGEAKHAKFSVRAAMNVDGVPAKFKPGHMDPSNPAKGPFDPQSVGWHPDSTMAKGFRKCIAEQVAGPREKYQVPMTTSQEMGWCQAPAGQMHERAHPVGKMKMGLGWKFEMPGGMKGILGHDGNGNTEADGQDTTISACAPTGLSAAAPSQLSRIAPSALSVTAPSHLSALSPSQLEVYKENVRRREERKAKEAKQTAEAGNPGKLFASASSTDVRRSAAASKLSKTSSLPSLTRDPNGHLQGRERKIAAAYAVNRQYMNGPHNKWYRPLSNSDIATFADEYTKCWGVGLYSNQACSGKV
eukprot:gnl/TRDRNA2_/TRDRNA2_37978_c0_seq1.p1 gnl/TRDRNA2_/TRDRNA2_37978_c0~~gnl/TRDRNA2_/TRDRNA2_37978_c0_seq1.p1  ORF type:complete len:325 (+),score=58.19 gnl/TRDRNA2_/TRDRNA2_37978_c0_seq1:112-1086(+)